MCGIVGYIGDREAADFLMDGLGKLEYRGYDSAALPSIMTVLLRFAKSGYGWPTSAEEVKKTSRRRHVRHRSHPLGNARRSVGHQCPSPFG